MHLKQKYGGGQALPITDATLADSTRLRDTPDEETPRLLERNMTEREFTYPPNQQLEYFSV